MAACQRERRSRRARPSRRSLSVPRPKHPTAKRNMRNRLAAASARPSGRRLPPGATPLRVAVRAAGKTPSKHQLGNGTLPRMTVCRPAIFPAVGKTATPVKHRTDGATAARRGVGRSGTRRTDGRIGGRAAGRSGTQIEHRTGAEIGMWNIPATMTGASGLVATTISSWAERNVTKVR